MVCRPAVGSCDVEERCPENDGTCPPNQFRADGDPCDEPPCRIDGTCKSGRCRNLHSKPCGPSDDGCCPRDTICSLILDADCGVDYTPTAIPQPSVTAGPGTGGNANGKNPTSGLLGSGAGSGDTHSADLFLGDGGAENVAVLEGNGQGGFAVRGLVGLAAAAARTGGAGVVAAANVADLALGDVDGDGNPDLMVALDSVLPNSDEIVTLLGNGALEFMPGPRRRIAGNPVRLQLAEVTADGHLDALVATDAGLEVLRGVGDGSFTRLALLDAGTLVTDVAVSSTVIDGLHQGIVAALRDAGRVKVYEMRDGLVEEASSVEVEQPRVLAVGDFTGDGLDDLAVGSDLGFVAVSPGLVAGGFGAALAERIEGLAIGEMRRADVNTDSLADLVVLDGATGAVELLVGRGDGTFDVLEGPTASGPAAGLVVADFNGDRIPDLIVSGPEVVIATGSVAAPPILAGDATGEGDVDEADLTRLTAEIYDGDGTDAMSCGGGAVLSAPGADANLDGRINAADIVGAIRSR